MPCTFDLPEMCAPLTIRMLKELMWQADRRSSMLQPSLYCGRALNTATCLQGCRQIRT